jgi:hypothetical protein
VYVSKTSVHTVEVSGGKVVYTSIVVGMTSVYVEVEVLVITTVLFDSILVSVTGQIVVYVVVTSVTV